MSQKAELIEESQRNRIDQLDQPSGDCSIEDILGDKNQNKSPDQKSSPNKLNRKKKSHLQDGKKNQYKIANNDEKISNSSSPIINESLQK